ncbi:MAG: aminotransferase class I/II-fold pyridoxal phosphate-dependent enzyme, partial [Dinoroseobacter sp.]|nr:aminotransferase class I/II-fold pyridoxal phosphate-dependent enzyme [Dinoroseobacter sp.]
GRLATERIIDDLSKLHGGDVVILHACCHNPTGADPDADLQNEMLALIEKHGAVPLIDAAYLGFAASPAADTGMIGEACARLPEVMVAFSGSKSFGLYRERVGLACVLSHAKAAVQSHLAVLNRMDFTFPPDHGARCVSVILDTPDLRKIWETELERIRETLSQARSALTQELRDVLQSDRFDTCLNKRGMFLLLPLGTERVARLRHDHAIYAVGDGRINLAGITPETALPVARALARVLRD